MRSSSSAVWLCEVLVGWGLLESGDIWDSVIGPCLRFVWPCFFTSSKFTCGHCRRADLITVCLLSQCPCLDDSQHDVVWILWLREKVDHIKSTLCICTTSKMVIVMPCYQASKFKEIIYINPLLRKEVGTKRWCNLFRYVPGRKKSILLL